MAYDRKPLPEYLGRKDEGRMDDDEFNAVVQHALADSVQWVDSEVSADRELALKYYQGKPFGDETDGRSKVVLTEVRDAIDGMLPSLMRVFFGAEHCVEFVPTRSDAVEQAAQKTDYVRYVFEEDNGGFLQACSVIKDGLRGRLGIFKWGWDESRTTRAYKQQGVTKPELDVLAANDAVKLGRVEQKDDTYDVEFTHTTPADRCWIKAIPPEEYIFNREARSPAEATVQAHRTMKTRGELIALGIKEKDIDEHGGAGNEDGGLRQNPEEIARREAAAVGRASGVSVSNDPEMGKANNKILYTEADMTIDFDGDGVAELRHVCCIGPTYYPVKNDPTDEPNFAVFSPYPEPHTLIGGSVSDRTMDMQRITSALFRGGLDSLAASLFPRTVYKDGMASVADIMNTAIGAPIREREAGVVRTLEMPFVGKEVMPLIAFAREVIERRTGRNKGAAGLDADALQSTGAEAVGAVLTGSQEQLEMIARVFAEMTLKPLFRGVGRMLQKRQPKARMVRLRGKWVDVDPTTWDDGMDVSVNVGLGTSFTDKKIQTLVAVAADQKELASVTGGLQSPVVSLPKILNTRAKILALQGLKDFESYYTPLPPDWQPPQPQGPPPDPEAQWIAAEKEMAHTKAMKELAIKQDELTLKREEMMFDQAFRIKELAQQEALKRYEIEMHFGNARSQADMDREIDAEVRETEFTLQAHQQIHDQKLSVAEHEHGKEMAEREQAVNEQTAQEPTE